MKNYTITMPFAGAITMSVSAENEEEAKEKFYNATDEINIINHSEIHRIGADVLQCEYYEKMVSGNVCHVSYKTVEIDEN